MIARLLIAVAACPLQEIFLPDQSCARPCDVGPGEARMNRWLVNGCRPLNGQPQEVTSTNLVFVS